MTSELEAADCRKPQPTINANEHSIEKAPEEAVHERYSALQSSDGHVMSDSEDTTY